MRRFWQRAWNAPATARRRGCALNVELLEERQLLSGTNVTYHGGPLLQHVQVESAYYGPAWSTDTNLQQQIQQVDGYLQYFTSSPYMDVLKQYNVGHGTFLDHDLIAQNPPNGQSIDDSQIRTVLNAEIAAHRLGTPTADRLYVFVTAPGVAVTAGGQNSVTDFAGYHDVFTDSAGGPVYYVVLPYPTGQVSPSRLTDFQQETLILSHEVAEGVTDPDTQTGWFDTRQGEISDLGEGTSGILHGYVVQGVWSQVDGKVVVPTDVSSATLHVTGLPVQATASLPFTALLATVTGANPDAAVGDFTATINWGDGTTSDGTLRADPSGGFDISGTHTYSQSGWYPITVTVADPTGAVAGTALTKVSVAPAPPTVTAKGTLLQATAGQQFSGGVATFTDIRPKASPGEFTATIDWGDGTTSTGTITADPNGGFAVNGTHTYANTAEPVPGYPFSDWGFFGPQRGGSGNQFFVVSVTIHDTPAKGTATALALASVTPVPLSITAESQNVRATSGQAFSGIVATLIAKDSKATADRFTATLNWGDGTTSSGTISADPKGGFDVNGTHTYTSGNHHFVVTVTVTDKLTQDQATTESLATVVSVAPNLSVTARDVSVTASQVFSGIVAVFTDVDPKATASGFTATIDWGDGTTSAGTITADPKGGFDVSGTHTYASVDNPSAVWDSPNGRSFGLDGNSFTLTVTVASKTTTDAATDRSLVSVLAAPTNLHVSGTAIEAVSGQAFSGTVATFSSLSTTATADGFTATIDWGDGTTSTGTISADPKGGFDVTGSHTYLAPGNNNDVGEDWQHSGRRFTLHGTSFGSGVESFIVTVTIHDKTANNATTAVSLTNVSPPPPNILAAGQSLSLSAGKAFSGTVASFTDADGNGAANFRATIDWGDGTISSGTITAKATGDLDVVGSHTYVAGGTYGVFVRIRDRDGDSAFTFGSATVADTISSTVLAVVDQAFLQSSEYDTNLVVKDYQQYLGRAPGAAEVTIWVNALQHGATDMQVLAGFLSSTEYYQRAGNSDQAWVDALYRDLLSRSADATGESAWLQNLAAGVQKANIALGIATSQEREGIVVQDDYQQYLGRSAGAAEITFWVNALQHGTPSTQVLSGFLSSQEYFQMHHANARDWLSSTYQDILYRKPDQAGYASWLSVLGVHTQ
jgi:hypothetical protein